MPRPWILMSPSSKGIGLHMTRRILQNTAAPVVATARKDVDNVRKAILEGLDVDGERLHVLPVDVLDESTIEKAAKHCSDAFPSSSHHLHLAMIQPGILFPEKSPAKIDAAHALLTLQTNLLGPMLMLKHFSGFLPKKVARKDGNVEDTQDKDGEGEVFKGLDRTTAKFAMMTARVGSVSDNKLGGWYSYRASKSGVNQLVKTLDNHLAASSGDAAVALGLHPGTVKTSLSKEFWGSVPKDKLFEPEFAAECLVDLLTKEGRVGVTGRGKLWDWDGKEITP